MNEYDWRDHEWEDIDGVVTCTRCYKTFGEADEQDDPIICWAPVGRNDGRD